MISDFGSTIRDFLYLVAENSTVNSVVGLVGVLIVALFLVGMLKPEFRRVAPSIMTSLGILGTFVGILLALLPLDFNEKSIDDNIKALLNGMQTAFITSCLGLAAAIGARLLWWSDVAKHEPIGRGEGRIIERLLDIKRAIVGDNHSNLAAVNQQGFAKLDGLSEAIREALVENLKNLITEIREVFKNELSKSLRQLIDRIDKTINEKLGQKLDQFNQSVDLLRAWQMQHREQVRELTVAFREVATGIKDIKDNLAKIPETMTALKESVIMAHGQITDLDNRLKAFADMKDKAEKAFPAIDKKLDEVLTALDGVAKNFAGLDDAVKKIHTETMTQIEGSHERAKKVAENHASEVKKLVADMRAETKQAVSDLRKEMESQMGGMANEWGRNLTAIARECSDAINATRNPPR